MKLTEYKENKLLVNIGHILKVRQHEDGAYVYFDVVKGNGNSIYFASLRVTERYEVIKRELQ